MALSWYKIKDRALKFSNEWADETKESTLTIINISLKIIFAIFLFFLSSNLIAQDYYGQVMVDDYDSGDYDLCKICNTFKFYFTAFSTLISVIVFRYLITWDSKLSKYFSISLLLITLSYLIFISDYPILDTLIISLSIFFMIGGIVICLIILFSLLSLVIKISKLIFSSIKSQRPKLSENEKLKMSRSERFLLTAMKERQEDKKPSKKSTATEKVFDQLDN